MAWLMLVAAGLLEVAWAYSMKLSEGFTRPLYTLATVAGLIVSFALLATAMRSLPLGTAYTIWTGIGAVGSFIVGLYFLGEPATPMRILAAVIIIAGLVMMKLAS
ncbi:MAG: multidrug efflux SMR transporter [Pantoea sp.]|uniref:Guanidinium exporter n=1 Tax=Pantoea wallisii TaxID=1076551 RepID=A0A1X1D787_9GAMM|nr:MULTISPECIES: multidrug efflux SMR transporter [Pantoea]MDU5780549.1 multidrug efflux SMR transporter [Pantoea sp.]ORM72430.1 QacE family quaternary ammonium compound efflux SMR transporter [Pantoea wallisii]